jgi:3-hydroxymyristoyl/3-hydroxydecanoyl-(acyl carrier protein) dehydratase
MPRERLQRITLTMTTRDVYIAEDHPAFEGHFDGLPILPGVVLLSLVTQSLAAVMPPLTLHSAKFLAPVRPGTALQIRTEAATEGRVRFEIHDASRCVASGSLETSR